MTYCTPPPDNGDGASGLPSAFINASISPLPMIQGGTEVVRVQVRDGYSVSGMLVTVPCVFSRRTVNRSPCRASMHCWTRAYIPCVWRLSCRTVRGNPSSRWSWLHPAIITAKPVCRPATIDPAVTEPENQQVYAITNLVNGTKYWNGIFTSPAVYPDEFTSLYGTRRTYIGSNSDLTVEGFHTGLDFAGGEGLQIFAPAPGQVVFAGPLTVRGNATIIDHGWGVYSGFWHQSAIYVKTGDFVEQGQVIGLVGGTGRVTGPHLHWEVWVNGVQVDPLDWLDQAYP
jgi:hypothetical protein